MSFTSLQRVWKVTGCRSTSRLLLGADESELITALVLSCGAAGFFLFLRNLSRRTRCLILLPKEDSSEPLKEARALKTCHLFSFNIILRELLVFVFRLESFLSFYTGDVQAIVDRVTIAGLVSA